MSNTLRKTLSIFLCLALCLSLFPAAGFAEEFVEEELLFDSDYVEEPIFPALEEEVIQEEFFEEDFILDDEFIEEFSEPEEIFESVDEIEQDILTEGMEPAVEDADKAEAISFTLSDSETFAEGAPTASEAFAALLDACANPNFTGDLDLTGVGEIEITQDLSIPVNMHVQARGDSIVVPNNVTLTVYGEFLIDSLLVEQGGRVVVDGSLKPSNESAHMDIPFAITVLGSMELINKANVDTGVGAWMELDQSKITYNQGRFDTHYEVNNEQELLDSYQHLISNNLNTYANMTPNIEVRFPFKAGQIPGIPANARIRSHAGTHIPQGVTFTIDEGGIFGIFNENLLIDGTLVNNGRINLNGPTAVLGETGNYSEGNTGSIFRNGQRFTFKTNSELLAELEQAIANGDNYFNLAGMGDFELTNGLTIPQNFKLESWGTNVILPAGKTVTVQSDTRFELQDLIVEEGASVIIENGGYLNTYDFLDLYGTITAGNNVRMHIPADTDISKITFGLNCDINIHFRPSDEETLLDMLAYAEDMEEPYYPDIQPQFNWVVDDEVTFDRVHLSVNRKNGSLVIADGGVLRLNRGLYSDGAVITIDGGTLINNADFELDENSGVHGSLQVLNNGVYTGSGVIAVKNVPFESAENYISGLDLTRFNKIYDEGWGATIFVDTGAVLSALQSAIENHESYFNMNNLGPVSLDENETLVIPEGMHVSAWGTTLVVPAGATLNVIGDYSGTGLELYGQLLMGKNEVDWNRNNSFVNIRDIMVFGKNAQASVGLQANLNLPAYALTDEVISSQIHRVHNTSWVALNWNAFDAQALNTAISRVPGLPEGYNGHADIRFPWVINGTVEIPMGLNLFVDGAYDEGSITISEGAKLISNDFINLNAAPMNVYGTLTNNNRVEINYDSGDRYAGYGTIQFGNGGVYEGNGDFCIPSEIPVGEVITGMNMTGFDAINNEGSHTIYRNTDNIWELFVNACGQSYDSYYDYNLSNLNAFTLRDSITIPQNMDVSFWGTNLIIPEGKTLTVYGGLHGDHLTVNGQLVLGDSDSYMNTVTVGSNGHVTLRDWAVLHTEWYNSPDLFYSNNKVSFNLQEEESHTEIRFLADAPDDTEFGILVDNFSELEEHYCGKIRVVYDKVLTSDLDAQANGLQIEVYSSLTVNPGVTFHADWVGLIGGSMVVNGTLISNQELRLEPDYDRGRPAGTISFANDASYVSDHGWFFVNDAYSPDSHIQGLDMNRFDIIRYSDRSVGYHMKEHEEPIEYAADLSISSETLHRGDQVTVSVSLSEGIDAKMVQFAVQYDSNALRLVSSSAGDLLTGKSSPTINGQDAGLVIFVWADTSHALSDGGTLLNLTFEDAGNSYTGETLISFAGDDTYESIFKTGRNGENIPLNFVSGTINIVDFILGDATNDRKINVEDVYAVLEHSVKINLLEGTSFVAADVNHDGKVNVIDANIISRFVARIINEF